MGACRAIGRTFENESIPLFLRLFPSPSPPSNFNVFQNNSNKNNLPSFKSSYLIKKQTLPNLGKSMQRPFSIQPSATWAGSLSSQDVTTDFFSLISSQSKDNHFLQSSYSYSVENQREIQLLFYKFGSCFSQLSQSNQTDFSSKKLSKPYKFSLNQLENVLSIAKNLLNKDLLESLDQSVKSIYFVSYIFKF